MVSTQKPRLCGRFFYGDKKVFLTWQSHIDQNQGFRLGAWHGTACSAKEFGI